MKLYGGLTRQAEFTLTDTAAALSVFGDKRNYPAVVYGCVDYIANKVRVAAWRTESGGSLPRWLTRPDLRRNGYTHGDFFHATVMSLGLWPGMAYWEIFRGSNGRIMSVVPLDPRMVTADDSTGQLELTISDMALNKRREREVVVIRNIIRPGRLIGFDPITNVKHLTQAAVEAEIQTHSTFKNAAIIPGVIKTKGELNKTQARLIRAQFRARNRGPHNNFLPVVLGDAEWQDVASSHVDAQFLETHQYTEAKITRQLYHLDPTLMGVPVQSGSLTYQNVTQRDLAALKDAVWPYLSRIEQGLAVLAPAMGMTAVWESLLRRTRMEILAEFKLIAEISRTMGRPLLTIDAMRDELGEPELTDEDISNFKPGGMDTIAVGQSPQEGPDDDG